MKRLTLKEWATIIENIKEWNESEQLGNEIEVLYLESTDEYVLCLECEIFEDGFKTEAEAWQRYDEILKLLEN